MKAPAAVIANEKIMSAEMMADRAATQKILLDMSISNENANFAIDAFNARWIAAGGIIANSLVKRPM